MSDTDYSDSEVEVKPKKAAGKKKVEDIYKKSNLRQHILDRPDTYVGSVELESDKIFVLNSSGTQFEQRSVTYAPALLKIFDEILVNAADNKQRDPKNMDELRVDFDQSKGMISVYNNGEGIPITLHNEYKIYIPELIFGHLLTSSNYDDSEKRTVGGRNGFGAKLANIYSKRFIVETCDGRQEYSQTFKNNMADKDDPVISKRSGASWTRVTFYPDLQRFGMSTFDDDFVSLLTKRVWDIAGTCGKGMKVYLNNKRLTCKNFESYCSLYFPPGIPNDMVFETINDRWEVAIAPAPDSQFTQVSFVNRINTLKGGTHVNALADQVTAYLSGVIEKKNKKITLKPQHVKNHMWIFVNSLIENPSFNTQTKVLLTSKKKDWGSSPDISETVLKKVAKGPIASSILAYAQFQQNKELKKNDAKKKTQRLMGIPKLEDANLAGTKSSPECTLIITEGDSAKALAMAGLSIVGRDLFGVFPIRGKLLNVREASTSQIVDNAEITYLKQIIGLQQGKDYKDVSSLRYGHIMVMTDQDHDGSHIKGLVINMFATFWPSLLKIPGFLTEFITPIVKVTKGATKLGSHNNNKKQELSFYTIPQYEEWKESTNGGKSWNKPKYFKGLGTSTSAEAKIYFANIDTHQVPFRLSSDATKCFRSIELAFARTHADERKAWMEAYIRGTYLNHNVPSITYGDFINKDMILFAIASTQRAIPSLIDGLKPSQRKVLYACFKRSLTNELKVAQLTGYTAEQTAYHHGEASLSGTIVNLAQNYVGANNVNYLWPAGQFGTRAQGGKDAASARYIFTHLSPVTRTLFHISDDPLLNYLDDDGQSIEPEFYVPIIPTVLVNGSSGIATGWASDIPNHNPRDVVNNIRRMIRGEEPEMIHPWYKGFIGRMITKGKVGTYLNRGLYEIVDEVPNTIHIYELPVGRWTSEYKAWLEDLLKKGEVISMSEYHTDVTVSFCITLSPEAWKKALEKGIESFFKLESSLTYNIVLFDKNGVIKKYDNVIDVFKEYYPIRLELYGKRKAYLINVLETELSKISNKARFIQYVIDEKIQLRNTKKAHLLDDLIKYKFDPFSSFTIDKSKLGVKSQGVAPDEEVAEKIETVAVELLGEDVNKDSDDDNDDDDDDNYTSKSSKKGRKGTSDNSTSGESAKDAKVTHQLKEYTYLISMPLFNLTYEKVQELLKEKGKKEEELRKIQSTTLEEFWTNDLDAFEEALRQHEEIEQQELQAGEHAAKKTSSTARKRAKAMMVDSDNDGDESDDWGTTKKKVTKKAGAKSKGEKSIPSYISRILDHRPTEQEFIIEQESEKERKRRMKQQAKLDDNYNDVAALLGFNIDTSSQQDSMTSPLSSTSITGTKRKASTTATKKAATSRGGKRAKKGSDSEDDFIDSDDSDDDDEWDSGDDSDVPKAKRARKAPAASKTTKAATTAATKTTKAKAEPKAKAPAKRATKSASNSSDDGSDDDSDDDFAPKKKPAASKAKAAPAAAKAPAKRKIIDTDDDDNDSDDEVSSKKVTKTSRSAPPPPAEEPSKPMSLKDKLALKTKGSSILGFLNSSTGTSTSSLLTSSTSTSTSSIGASSLSRSFMGDDDDDDNDPFAAATSRPQKSKPITSIGMIDSDSDDDVFGSLQPPKPKAQPAVAPAETGRSGRAKKPVKYIDSDSEDSDY